MCFALQMMEMRHFDATASINLSTLDTQLGALVRRGAADERVLAAYTRLYSIMEGSMGRLYDFILVSSSLVMMNGLINE